MLVKMAELVPKSDLERQRISEAINRVMDSGQYIGGPEVTDFEQKWAKYCGANYCVGVSSGFSALQLIVQSYGFPKVYYSSLTCPPTRLAIEAAGSEAVAVAPLVGDYILSGWRDLGVLVNVLLYGIIDPDVIEHTNRTVIDDAAQAHGLNYRLARRSLHTTAAAWSFYPTKNLGAIGDAGAITTNHPDLAAELRRRREYKRDGGVNARMDPIQAAVLSAKLPFLDQRNAQRTANASLYQELLRGLPIVRPTHEEVYDATTRNWHQYPIRVISKERQSLRVHLGDAGIETQIHYPEAQTGTRQPNQWESVWSKAVLSLPVGPHLGERDILYVAHTIKSHYEGRL
jgi:dTDP-4-amino-4,6-dideoxygalactose transaminase